MSATNAAPVLDVVGAGQAFKNTLVAVINELAAGMTVTRDGSATPVTDFWKLPERVALVPGGQLVDDGEQCTILFSSMTRGLPGQPQSETFLMPAHMLQYVTYEVNLIRQVAGLDNSARAPAPDTLESDFGRLTLDAELLWATLVQIHAQGLVVPNTEHFAFGPLLAIGPEGRMAGFRCPVSWVWAEALGTWAG